jgi:hypothetical protein
MKIYIIVIILFLFIISIESEAVYIQNITTGTNVLTVVYYTDTSTSFIHTQTVATSPTSSTVYVVGVEDGAFTPTPLVCQPLSTTRVVIGNKGCGKDTGDTSCVNSNTEALVNKNEIENYFYLTPESDECIAAVGKEKAALTCLGPLYINMDIGQGPMPITNETLIISRGVYSRSGYGYNCHSPAITWLDIEMPSLFVNATGTCSAFTGIYEIYAIDPVQRLYSYIFGDKKLIFIGNGTQQMILNQAEIPQFYFNFTAGWNYRLPETYGNGSCSFVLSIVPIPSKLALRPRETLNSNNYYLNKLPLYYESQSICNFRICGVNDLFELKDPYCLENTVSGGYDPYRTTGSVSVPLQVIADASYASYIEDCDSFWPWSPTFQVYTVTGRNDGPEQARYVPSLFSCFAPFYDLDAINGVSSGSEVEGDRVYNEKFKQCSNLGGILVGGTHCGRQVDMQSVEPGFVYFKSYAYKFFNPETDLQYQVSDADADVTCALFGSDVTVYRGFDPDIRAFVQNLLVGYKKQKSGFPYRIPIAAQNCECYDRANEDSVFATSIGPAYSTVEPCNCDIPNFPLCRYWAFSRPIPHYFVGMSPDTRRILRDGQVGINWNGQPGQCQCYAGSGGIDCDKHVCPPPTSVFGTETGNVLNDFFSRCYWQGRGVCFEQNPRTCVCEPGYNPPASLLASEGYSTEFKNFPCACPSSSQPSLSGFIANGVFYRNYSYGICGGSSNGQCLYENGTTISRCVCHYRTNPWNNNLEKAMDGKACTCQNPLLPYKNYELNGGINTGICNSRGTCCASGEIQANQRVPGQDTSLQFRETCTNNDLTAKEGCVCDNGFTGNACTCPSPFDVAVDLPIVNSNFRAYVDLKTLYFVERVETGVPLFSAGTCTVTAVTTQNALNRITTNCTYNPGNTWSIIPHWNCNVLNTTQFVVLNTAEETPSCTIKVFSKYFPPCGFNTLPYSGRFFDTTRNRGIDLNTEVQTINFAPKGCTNTECMCDSLFTGKLCAYGISSKRQDLDGNFTSRTCGETTLPARGTQGEDACECFKNNELVFTNKSCECALVNGELCAAHGTCRLSNFALGFCEKDTSDYLNDPLSNPYSNVTQSIIPFTTFTLTSNGIFTVNNQSWLFYFGQSVTFDIVSDEINICQPLIRYPLNMEYICPEDVDPPRRAIAQVWELTHDEFENTVIVTETCDPSAYEGDLACLTRLYCNPRWNLTLPSGQLPCIYNQSWSLDLSDENILLSGNYTDVVVLCGTANATSSSTQLFPYGVLDCSNPITRIGDDQIVKLNFSRQCNYPMTEYSATRGAAYGLFANAKPGLDFINQPFGRDHAAFVASFINNTYCYAQLDFKPILDAYYPTWITQVVEAETSGFSNQPVDFTNTPYTNTYQDFFFDGAFGSEILANLATWPNLTANFTFPTRAGISSLFPDIQDEQVRQYSFIATQEMNGLQVYGAQGQLCATYLRNIMPGERVILNCLVQFTGVPLVDALTSILLNSTYPNKTYMAQQYLQENQTLGTIWYQVFDLPVIPLTNFSIISRPSGFQGYWNDLTFQIVNQGIFPPNQQYVDSCIAAGKGYRAIDLDTDIEYLHDFWYTWLAPRRCGSNIECLTQDLGKCVSDIQINRPWANGDDSDLVAPQNFGGIVGDEGGCVCDNTFQKGFWNSFFFCSQCTPSYGPVDQTEYFAAVNFQTAIQEKYDNFSFFPLYDPETINITNLCVYPTDPLTTQDTLLCGGRGEIKTEQTNTTYDIVVFPGNLTRRCTGMFVNDNYFVLQNTTNTIQVTIYTNNTNELVIIDNAVFLDGIPLGVPSPQCNYYQQTTCYLNPDVKLDCVEGVISEVYNSQLNVTIEQSSFFLSIVI